MQTIRSSGATRCRCTLCEDGAHTRKRHRLPSNQIAPRSSGIVLCRSRGAAAECVAQRQFKMICERPPAAFGGSPPRGGEKERSERGGHSYIISNCSWQPWLHAAATPRLTTLEENCSPPRKEQILQVVP